MYNTKDNRTMRTRTNVRAARWLALLLVMVGLFAPRTSAASDDEITIPARTFPGKWGTVHIPAQEFSADVSNATPIAFTVSDIPEGFTFKRLFIENGRYTVSRDELTLAAYQDAINIGIVASPLPVQSADALVNMFNIYDPGCAYLSGDGDVVVTKDIKLSLEEYEGLEDRIRLEMDYLSLGTEGHIYSMEQFKFDMENARLVIRGGNRWDFKLINTVVEFNKFPDYNGYNLSIEAEVERDVSFKGILDDETLNYPCLGNSAYVDLNGMDDAHLTIENLIVATDAVIGEGTIISAKKCTFDFTGGSLNGGEIQLDSCWIAMENSPSFEKGRLTLNHSRFSNGDFLFGGKDMEVEINNGLYRNLIVKDGSVTLNNGYISGAVTMEGGSLEVNDGAITSIVVNNSNCDIALNKGLFGSVYMPSGVNKSISSLLGGNARYYDRDGTYMFYDLGFTVERVPRTEYSQIVGYTYPISFVRSERGDVVVPPAAFVAAQEASVGPNGTDVRVRENGDLEIWTPEGLAWLAFLQSDTHDRVRNGRDYLDESGDWYLMADLDMSDYGAGWPDLSIPGGKVFDGQRHRIYNMHVLKPDASFLKEVNGTVANLVVEGSVTNSEDEGGRLPKGDASWSYVLYNVSGFAQINKGTIINCAFKGGVWNAVPGYSYINGFVQTNVGEIKNCYATPCEELIGGARYDKDHLNNEYVCPTEHHWVSGFVHTNASLAVIDNCYYAGKLVFDYVGSEVDAYLARDISKVYDEEPMIEHFYYMESDIHVDTLNANVRDNTSVDYAPWSEWAVSEDKQCGHPYFVWETALYDPSVANEVVDVADDFQVWSEPGTLCFHSARAADVVIYSLRGVLRGRYDRHVGVKRVALPKGVYLVVYGTDARKVVVN